MKTLDFLYKEPLTILDVRNFVLYNTDTPSEKLRVLNERNQTEVIGGFSDLPELYKEFGSEWNNEDSPDYIRDIVGDFMTLLLNDSKNKTLEQLIIQALLKIPYTKLSDFAYFILKGTYTFEDYLVNRTVHNYKKNATDLLYFLCLKEDEVSFDSLYWKTLYEDYRAVVSHKINCTDLRIFNNEYFHKHFRQYHNKYKDTLHLRTAMVSYPFKTVFNERTFIYENTLINVLQNKPVNKNIYSKDYVEKTILCLSELYKEFFEDSGEEQYRNLSILSYLHSYDKLFYKEYTDKHFEILVEKNPYMFTMKHNHNLFERERLLEDKDHDCEYSFYHRLLLEYCDKD